MKQLLVIAAFFSIFIFFSGCKSETPVSPAGHDDPLDKPGVTISGEITIDEVNNRFMVLTTWLPVRNVLKYTISWTDGYGDTHSVDRQPDECSYDFNGGPLNASFTVPVTVTAYGKRDRVIATGNKDFTYTYISPNIDITGYVTITETGLLDFNADWGPVPDAVKYSCTLLRTLNGQTNDFEVTQNSFYMSNVSTKGADASFIFTVVAKNSDGNEIAAGTKTVVYTYTPPAVPNIELTGSLTPYENYYLNINVQWEAVTGAVSYHILNFRSSNGVTYYYDHDYIGLMLGNVNPIIPGVFNVITVEAKDANGAVIAAGSKTFTYTPL